MKSYKTISNILLVLTINLTTAQNWTSQNSGTNNQLDAVWFTNTLNGWVVGDLGTILFTNNGGQTWQPVNLTNQDLDDVAFLNETIGLIVGDNGIIFRTTNSGQNWTQISSGTGSNLHAIGFGQNGMAYAAGRDGVILRSTDNGASWNVIETGTVRYEGLWAFGNQHAWIVGREGVIKATNNSGLNWNSQSSSTGSDLNNAFFVSTTEGWAVGQNSTLIYTNNGGTSWLSRNTGINFGLEGVHFLNQNQGYVVGNTGAVYKTDNGGLNWVFETSGTANELQDVFFSDANHGWAVGLSGTIVNRLSVAVEEDNQSFNQKTTLQISPNPLNRLALIRYSIKNRGLVELTVHDITGNVVKSLINREMNPGNYSIEWNGTDDFGRTVSNGIYFYQLQTKDEKLVKKAQFLH